MTKEEKEVVKTIIKIAKKDFIISQNNKEFAIIKGKPLPKGLPEIYLINLKTEGVI